MQPRLSLDGLHEERGEVTGPDDGAGLRLDGRFFFTGEVLSAATSELLLLTVDDGVSLRFLFLVIMAGEEASGSPSSSTTGDWSRGDG